MSNPHQKAPRVPTLTQKSGRSIKSGRSFPLSWLMSAEGLAKYEEHRKLEEEYETALTQIKTIDKQLQVLRIREEYGRHNWPWGAAAEFLFRALIRAVGLENEDELLWLAKAVPGRNENRELAERIWRARSEGKTARQIKVMLEREGDNLTIEAVESYLKTRRKRLKL